jgi:hypothetical protein
MNQSTTTTPKKNLRASLILFLAIVTGIFIFMLIAIVIGQSRGPLSPDLNKHHTTIAIGMAVISFACLLGARQVFNKGVAAAKNSVNPLNERLSMHRNALIRYLFICEMPVFLSIIIFMLTGNFIFQVYAAVFIGFMLTVMPTRKKVADDLGLSSQEQQELV